MQRIAICRRSVAACLFVRRGSALLGLPTLLPMDVLKCVIGKGILPFRKLSAKEEDPTCLLVKAKPNTSLAATSRLAFKPSDSGPQSERCRQTILRTFTNTLRHLYAGFNAASKMMASSISTMVTGQLRSTLRMLAANARPKRIIVCRDI